MTLNKKLFRDLYEHRGANIAAIIVIMIGIMIFNGAAVTLDTLVFSKEMFYKKGDFPQVYAVMLGASEDTVQDLETLKGIQRVEGRLVQDLKVANTSKTIRMMSTTKQIGKYVLEEGAPPREGEDEFLIYNWFAKENGYRLGDRISLVSQGKIKSLKICGIAFSPETIYPIKDETSPFPNSKDFGIGFIDLKTLRNLTGKNVFSELLFTLERGVRFEEVKDILEKELKPYGLLRLYPMKDQSSELMVDGEIQELRATMVLMPLIFLGTAALVMSIMVKRIIEQQRGQIGILKAFGYSDWTVGLHYASYCVLLGVAGGLLGGFAGFWFSNVMLGMYQEFFNMEYQINHVGIRYFSSGVLLAGIFSMIVGVRTSLKAVRIMPSEAMREEAPKNGKKSIVEKFIFFKKMFHAGGIMSVRNISRNRKRSFFVILGFAMAFAISVFPWTMLSMMNKIVYERFESIEKYDAKVFLTSLEFKSKAEREMQYFPGVFFSQGISEIPFTLSKEGVKQEVQLIGLDMNSKLYVVTDEENRPISIPKGGIILSERLSEKLNVGVGDFLWMESPYAKYKEERKKIRVAAVVQQSIGMNGYMEIQALSNILGYSPVSNAILLDVRDHSVTEQLREKYQDSKKVLSIQSKEDTIEQIRQRMDIMYQSMYFMALLASAMSFAIVYNTYIVVLMERKREFSTLMVLGMKDREVLSMISLEQWMMTIVGMILGLPIAKGFIVFISKELSTDMFSLKASIDLWSIGMSALLMGISVFLAQILAGKKIAQVDIVDALKSGE